MIDYTQISSQPKPKVKRVNTEIRDTEILVSSLCSKSALNLAFEGFFGAIKSLLK